MSILARLQKQETEKPYILVVGRSSAGKTTLSGTLSGRTLLIQPKGKERGAQTAISMAKTRGNEVVAVSVSSVSEILQLAEELKTDKSFDSIYLDGLTALTFLVAEDPIISELLEAKKGSANPFLGYEKIRAEVAKVNKALSELTYASVTKPKNVIVTLAIDIKTDMNGAPLECVPAMRGKASFTEFTRPSPTIVTLASRQTEQGLERILLTANNGIFLGRVNGILDEVNPKVIEPDLSKLLSLMETK